MMRCREDPVRGWGALWGGAGPRGASQPVGVGDTDGQLEFVTGRPGPGWTVVGEGGRGGAGWTREGERVAGPSALYEMGLTGLGATMRWGDRRLRIGVRIWELGFLVKLPCAH